MKTLVYGSSGWIGGKMINLLKGEVVCGKSRLENRDELFNEINYHKPTHILNCAGLTGRPNIDWCESNKKETIRVNVIGTLNLCDIGCDKAHVTILATGCIYEYDELHPLESGIGFTEKDEPNFKGSFYSLTKGFIDKLFESYDNLLVLRIRMPLSDEYNHPRNFITKITKYEKVVNIQNSMTDLDVLLPIAIDMMGKNITSKFNLTNPGTISHNEVLELYKKYVDPNFNWINFSLEEQSKVIKAGRSNNELDVSKLLKYYPDIPNIKISTHSLMKRMSLKVKSS